jgi:hypothetical protein
VIILNLHNIAAPYIRPSLRLPLATRMVVHGQFRVVFLLIILVPFVVLVGVLDHRN